MGSSSTAVTPELGQVPHRRVAGEARVGAAQLGRHLGMELGEALDVDLVDDGARPAGERRPVAFPVEGPIDHHALGQVRPAVAVVGRGVPRGVADPVAEEGVLPLERARDRLRVGIEQRLGRVEAVPLGGLVGTVHPVRVERAGADARDVGVPDLVGALLEPDLADLLARIALVEEAERHRGGVLAEEGEVDAGAVPGGAERVRPARAGAGSVGHGRAPPQAGISQRAPSGRQGEHHRVRLPVPRRSARSPRRPRCPRRCRRRRRRRN